jgi:hypothetical protein
MKHFKPVSGFETQDKSQSWKRDKMIEAVIASIATNGFQLNKPCTGQLL